MKCDYYSINLLKSKLQEGFKKGMNDGVPLDELMETDCIKDVFNEMEIPFDYDLKGKRDEYDAYTFRLGRYKKGIKRSQILDNVSYTPKEKPNIKPTQWAVNIDINFTTEEINCAFIVWVNYTDIYEYRQYDCPIELYNWTLIKGNK